MDLLESLRARFEEDGVLVIPDAVSPETIARVTEATDRIVREGGAPPRGGRDPERYVRCVVRPGDAVKWENRTFHAPENNTSPHTRKAVMVQYGSLARWAADHGLDRELTPEAEALEPK
jgi:ectoine hydroxylase-related dioxygenase (phytanoyl-CoA dioxygenase family)